MQRIITILRSHAARQLQHIACRGLKHEGVPVVAAVISILAALVVNLERLERFRDFIRHVVLEEHVHVMVSTVISLLQFQFDKRHRQVEACIIVVVIIRFEHERHGIAPAQDLAAYRYGRAVWRTLVFSKKNGVGISYRSAIDTQRISPAIRSHAARQLQSITRRGLKHESVPVVAAVGSILATLVINLERLERFRDFIRHVVLINHIHEIGCSVIFEFSIKFYDLHRQIQSWCITRAIRNKHDGHIASLTRISTIRTARQRTKQIGISGLIILIDQ